MTFVKAFTKSCPKWASPVSGGIHLGKRAQLRIAAEDQVGQGCRPAARACLAVGPFEQVLAACMSWVPGNDQNMTGN